MRGEDRAYIIAALECVTAVCVFPGLTAIEFLKTASPDIYVKGGDYTIETINQTERAIVEKLGASIAILPLAAGRSTSAMLSKLTF